MANTVGQNTQVIEEEERNGCEAHHPGIQVLRQGRGRQEEGEEEVVARSYYRPTP